jgi:hypothetical protein
MVDEREEIWQRDRNMDKRRLGEDYSERDDRWKLKERKDGRLRKGI